MWSQNTLNFLFETIALKNTDLYNDAKYWYNFNFSYLSDSYIYQACGCVEYMIKIAKIQSVQL